MQFATLAEWLNWLEQSHPREIDLGLNRIRQVAERMGLLTTSAKLITIGGTNGKGSCVAATSALLGAAGYSVGVYTSPHLLVYNERIAVNGAPVSDREICAAFEKIYSACRFDEPYLDPISLTYFEYGTLAAMEIFRERQVTAIVLEVGLGGRLDAVNLWDADVAVVTSVDIDHQDWLGDNREDIGYEKAGIFRTERPAICADINPPQRLLDYAREINARLIQRTREFDYVRDSAAYWSWRGQTTRFTRQLLPQLPLPSMAAALAVVEVLGLPITSASFDLVAQIRVPGRFQQVLWHERRLILDVAHNPAATQFLAANLRSLLAEAPGARVLGVVAMMTDKDRSASLANLCGLVDTWYLASLTIPRAATTTMLAKNLQELGQEVEFEGSVSECLDDIVKRSNPGDILLVFGSFFTVAAGLAVVSQPSAPVAA